MSDKVEIEVEELAELRTKAAAYDDHAAAMPGPADGQLPPSAWRAHPPMPWNEAAVIIVVVLLVAIAVTVLGLWFGARTLFRSIEPYGVTGQTVIHNACPVPLPSVYLSQCDRPVGGAHLTFTSSSDGDVTDVVSEADGSFFLSLYEGSYEVEAQPFEGMEPSSASIPLTLSDGEDPAPITIYYTK